MVDSIRFENGAGSPLDPGRAVFRVMNKILRTQQIPIWSGSRFRCIARELQVEDLEFPVFVKGNDITYSCILRDIE